MTSVTLTIRLPRSIVEKLEKEASRAGTNLEGYVLELLLRDVDDPLEKAREYVEVVRDLLEQAREELSRGDVRQAAEKTWGPRL